MSSLKVLVWLREYGFLNSSLLIKGLCNISVLVLIILGASDECFSQFTEVEAQPTKAAEWLNSLLPATHHLLLNDNSLFHLLVEQNLVSRRVDCVIRLCNVRRLYFYCVTYFRKQWPYYGKSCPHRTPKLFSVWEIWSYMGSRAQVERAFYKVGKEKKLPSTSCSPPLPVKTGSCGTRIYIVCLYLPRKSGKL